MRPPDTAEQLITALDLKPLPQEGGFFRQTWHNRTGTAIYFLVTPDGFSALHQLNRDEIWHFYAGDALDHVQIDPASGRAQSTRLGPYVLAGEHPQLVVPAGRWQGARLAARPGRDPAAPSLGFSLLGCTMSPPWDETGFTLGTRADLVRAFPQHAELIGALTR